MLQPLLSIWQSLCTEPATPEHHSAQFTALPLARTADDYEALLPWRIKLPAA